MAGDARTILVGVLLLQLDLVSPDQLRAAFDKWRSQRTVGLEEILLTDGHITKQQANFVNDLADKYIQLLGTDWEQSVVGLSGFSSLQTQLRELDDKRLNDTLESLPNSKQSGTHPTNSPSPDPTKDSAGADRGPRFRILRPHAKGGLGQVSVAEDMELRRQVALKEIQARYASDPDRQNRFLFEAEVTGNLEHPGIVPVYSLGRSQDGQPFYAMRFIKGDSLKQAIEDMHRRRSKMTAREVDAAIRKLLRRLVDVCNAIEYAHSRGVLHRDLKPGNIMLGNYGETLVVDWGLAKTIGKQITNTQVSEPSFTSDSQDGSTPTIMGSVVGTLAFMSPEQAEGRIDLLDATTDVYCLGGTLYSILTGESPIPLSDNEEMLRRIRRGQIELPSSLNGQTSKALEAICMRAMATRQSDRYPTALALAEELEQYLADEPVTAYREPILPRLARFARHHRSLAVATAATTLATLIGLIVITSLTARHNSQLQIARDQEQMQRIKAEAAELAERARRSGLQEMAVELMQSAEGLVAGTNDVETFRTQMMERAYKALKELAADDTSISLQEALAKAARLFGNQLARVKRSEEGLARLRESISLQEANAARAVKLDRDYLSETYRDLATSLRFLGRLNEAQRALAIASRISTELLQQAPASENYQRSLAIIQYTQAGIEQDLGNRDLAIQLAKPAFETLRRLSSSVTPKATDPLIVVITGTIAARNLNALKRFDESIALYKAAVDFAIPLEVKMPSDRLLTSAYARLLSSSAEADINAEKISEDSEQRIARSLTFYDKLEVFRSSSIITNHGDAMRVKARVLQAQGSFEAAKEQFALASKRSEEGLNLGKLPENEISLAAVLKDEALLFRALGDEANALTNLQRAKELATSAVKAQPETKRLADALQEIEDALK